MDGVDRGPVIELKEFILYGCHQFFVGTSPQVCPAYTPPEQGIACKYNARLEIKADTARCMSRCMDYAALKTPLAYLHSVFKAFVNFHNFISSNAEKRCLCRQLLIQKHIFLVQVDSSPCGLF